MWGNAMEFTQRTQMVVGEDRFEKVINKKICIVGVGGVGGAALEGIVRFGFKNIAIFGYSCTLLMGEKTNHPRKGVII